MKITNIEGLDYVGLTASLPLIDGVTTVTGPNAGGKTMLVNIVPGILFNEAKLQSGASIGFGWEGEAGPGSMFVSKQGAKTTWRGTANGEPKLHNTIKPAVGWMREHFPVAHPVFTTANFLAAFRSNTMLGGQPAARMQLLSDIVGLRVFEDLRKGVGELAKSANVTLAMRERIERELRELADMGAESEPRLYLGGIAGYVAERRSNHKAEALALGEALEDRPFGNIETADLEKILTLAPDRNRAWDAWDDCRKLKASNAKKPSKQDYNTALAVQRIVDLELEPLLISGKLLKDTEKHKNKLADHLAAIRTLNDQLSHLEGHSGSTCPTCGTAINAARLRKAITADRDAIKAKIDGLREKVKIAEDSDALRATLKEFTVTSKDARVMLAFTFGDVIEAYEAAVAIEQRFGGTLPTKPEKPRIDVAEVTAELKLRRKGYGKLKEGERKYDLLTKKFQGATGVLAAVTELAEEQAEVAANYKRLRKLREELRSLPNAEDAELLIELLGALDNRNARNKYLELVSEHLIQKLNELAPAFFSYKIEFAWTNGKLLANRKGATTDVVLLSGREGRTFTLLNAVAIQCCLPPAKRLRTLFLDELEAGSSPENRTLLAELIPTLLDYYSNICVVTPLAKHEFHVDGPRYAVKEGKNGKKTLVREE